MINFHLLITRNSKPVTRNYLKMNSYKDLDVYKLAYQLAIEVHKMTMTLPKYEMYVQGSQVRRSSKSIKDNIAEG